MIFDDRHPRCGVSVVVIFNFQLLIFNLQNFVHPTVLMLPALEAPLAEQSTEVLLIHTTHETRVTLAQMLIDVGSREQLRLFALTGLAEVLLAVFLHGWDVAVGAIALLDVLDLLGGEVMTLPTV